MALDLTEEQKQKVLNTAHSMGFSRAKIKQRIKELEKKPSCDLTRIERNELIRLKGDLNQINKELDNPSDPIAVIKKWLGID